MRKYKKLYLIASNSWLFREMSHTQSVMWWSPEITKNELHYTIGWARKNKQ